MTEANELTKAIHDRMPVILAPEAYGYLFKSIQDRGSESLTSTIDSMGTLILERAGIA